MSKSKSVTFGDMFELYIAYAKERLKSCGELIRLRKRYLMHLTGRKLSTLTRYELQMLHADIGKMSGRTAANRAIELVSVVINRAIDWDFYVGTNPCARIQKFRLSSRKRFLRPHEISRLFDALEACPNQHIKDLLYICLYTGARSGNVMSMKWSEVDLDEGHWVIPDCKSKNGDPYEVPLLPQAVEILRRREYLKPFSKFVFPGEGNAGHIRNPRKTWYKILAVAQIEDLRLHDLRRTMGSWQVRTGASLPIIGQTLNHRDPKSTLIYARLDHTPVREAMQTAVDAMHLARPA